MIEIEPRLEKELRAKYDRILATTLPQGLASFNPAADHRHHRALSLLAATAGFAVIAAGIVAFALELGGHTRPASPALATNTQLAKLPLLGGRGVPEAAYVVLPVRHGHGSAQLPTFVPQGTLYIQFDCAGPGNFQITATDHAVSNELAQCSSSLGATTVTVDNPASYDGKPLTLEIRAAQSMSWEIFIAQIKSPLPEFERVQADRQVLLPVTYGTGSATLPTFSIGPDETAIVQVTCNSGSSADALQLTGDSIVFEGVPPLQCSPPSDPGAANGLGFALPVSGGGSGPITAQITADPMVSWEVRVIEGPGGVVLPEKGNQGPVTSDVSLAPAAFGMGSAALPTFTPNQRYTIAFACSGAGTLTVVVSGVAHVATTLCDGSTGWFTPSDEVPGHPVSISVEAPPSVGWVIEAVQVYGSTWG
jgi:hypothetical protein